MLQALAITPALQAQNLVRRANEKPSFDCAKANSAAARLICADGDLARLDGNLGAAFQRRKSQISGSDQAALVAEQIAWIKDRNTRCELISKDKATIEALANSKTCMVHLIQERIAALTQTDPTVAVGCHKERDVFAIQGVATPQSLELADGSVKSVWILVADKPICVVDSVVVKSPPYEVGVSRFQIIGQPSPSNTAIELTGRLSTGNITQYYAEPEAIEAISGRRIAAPLSLNAERDASKFDANQVAALLDKSNAASRPAFASAQAQQSNPAKDEQIWGWTLLIFILGIYFLPSIVGSRHHNAGAIFVLNLFLGWTFLGWVIALVWACTKPAESQAKAHTYLNPGLRSSMSFRQRAMNNILAITARIQHILYRMLCVCVVASNFAAKN